MTCRYGSADLCRDHCQFLVSVLCHVRGSSVVPAYRHLVTLLWRLLPKMSSEHQVCVYVACLVIFIIRVRPIPVSGIGRYSPILVSIGISADTSSPVVHLPVSTVDAVATHACSFKLIPYFHAYTPHTYNLYTPILCTKSHFQYNKNLYSSVSVSVQLWPIVSGIRHLHGIGLSNNEWQ